MPLWINKYTVGALLIAMVMAALVNYGVNVGSARVENKVLKDSLKEIGKNNDAIEKALQAGRDAARAGDDVPDPNRRD